MALFGANSLQVNLSILTNAVCPRAMQRSERPQHLPNTGRVEATRTNFCGGFLTWASSALMRLCGQAGWNQTLWLGFVFELLEPLQVPAAVALAVGEPFQVTGGE